MKMGKLKFILRSNSSIKNPWPNIVLGKLSPADIKLHDNAKYPTEEQEKH